MDQIQSPLRPTSQWPNRLPKHKKDSESASSAGRQAASREKHDKPMQTSAFS